MQLHYRLKDRLMLRQLISECHYMLVRVQVSLTCRVGRTVHSLLTHRFIMPLGSSIIYVSWCLIHQARILHRQAGTEQVIQ